MSNSCTYAIAKPSSFTSRAPRVYPSFPGDKRRYGRPRHEGALGRHSKTLAQPRISIRVPPFTCGRRRRAEARRRRAPRDQPRPLPPRWPLPGSPWLSTASRNAPAKSPCASGGARPTRGRWRPARRPAGPFHMITDAPMGVLRHATFSRHARNKKDLHRGGCYDLLREAKATSRRQHPCAVTPGCRNASQFPHSATRALPRAGSLGAMWAASLRVRAERERRPAADASRREHSSAIAVDRPCRACAEVRLRGARPGARSSVV